jgi:hypothetical protein
MMHEGFNGRTSVLHCREPVWTQGWPNHGERRKQKYYKGKERLSKARLGRASARGALAEDG